jgi:hypothetical protein
LACAQPRPCSEASGDRDVEYLDRMRGGQIEAALGQERAYL